MIGNILKSSEYPLGTKLEGVITAIEKSGYDQYIHLESVRINDVVSPSIWMRATRTLGDFLYEHGHDAYTVVGHVIHFEKSHKRLQGFNGRWYDSDFFVPVGIE